jgi:hypothetical protein
MASVHFKLLSGGCVITSLRTNSVSLPKCLSQLVLFYTLMEKKGRSSQSPPGPYRIANVLSYHTRGVEHTGKGMSETRPSRMGRIKGKVYRDHTHKKDGHAR